jgi:hypothetical protein
MLLLELIANWPIDFVHYAAVNVINLARRFEMVQTLSSNAWILKLVLVFGCAAHSRRFIVTQAYE